MTPAQSNLALWLAFATPVSVAFLATVQIIGAKIISAMMLRQGRKIDEIHVFTNSALGASYKATAVALRLLANNTGKQSDMDAALLAEQISAAHDASQRIVDERKLRDAKG